MAAPMSGTIAKVVRPAKNDYLHMSSPYVFTGSLMSSLRNVPVFAQGTSVWNTWSDTSFNGGAFIKQISDTINPGSHYNLHVNRTGNAAHSCGIHKGFSAVWFKPIQNEWTQFTRHCTQKKVQSPFSEPHRMIVLYYAIQCGQTTLHLRSFCGVIVCFLTPAADHNAVRKTHRDYCVSHTAYVWT